MFADWAAQNTGGLDYLSPGQVERAWQEVEMVGDPQNRNPTVAEWTDMGMIGFRPDVFFAPGGAYNVVKINLNEASDYLIVLGGDAEGSSGASSHFEGRVVIMSASGPRYIDVDMSGPRLGQRMSPSMIMMLHCLLLLQQHPNTLVVFNITVTSLM